MADDASKPSIRILIVDDHPIIRDGIRMQLASQPDMEVCGEADDVAEALAEFESCAPDVVIVDLSLKSGSGLELIKKLVDRDERVRILVSSVHDEHIYAERAIQAGARGYRHKQEASRTLVEALRQVAAGRFYVSEGLKVRILSRVVQRGEKASIGGIERLTDRELQVFELIGGGKKISQISEELNLSPKTVETYRDRIRRKLDLDSSAQVVHYAVRWVSENVR